METLTLLLVLLVLGLWMLGAYNRLVRLRNNCTSLFTQVEQRARERHGLVDQLAQVLRSVLADQRGQVEIAAAAARQAGQALEATRQRPVRAGAVEQLSRAEEVLDQALSQLDEALRHHVSQQDASPLTPSDAARSPIWPSCSHSSTVCKAAPISPGRSTTRLPTTTTLHWDCSPPPWLPGCFVSRLWP